VAEEVVEVEEEAEEVVEEEADQDPETVHRPHRRPRPMAEAEEEDPLDAPNLEVEAEAGEEEEMGIHRTPTLQSIPRLTTRMILEKETLGQTRATNNPLDERPQSWKRLRDLIGSSLADLDGNELIAVHAPQVRIPRMIGMQPFAKGSTGALKMPSKTSPSRNLRLLAQHRT